MKKIQLNNKGFSTTSVHGGGVDFNLHKTLVAPIYQTATYTFEDTEDLHNFFQHKTQRIAEYGRYGNPTQSIVEKQLSALENTESCLLFPSGMSAVTTAILSICKQGDHIIITDDSYRRTRQFIKQVISKFGITFTFVKPEANAIEAAISNNTKLFISESPTNPYLRVLDLGQVTTICKKHKIKSLIDSTLATPYNQRPADFGIDLIVHSVTKYLGGHNDVLGGALLGKDYLISAVKSLQSIIGCIIDPNSSYLLHRGIKTFALRMQYQNESTLKIAHFLESHRLVQEVWYPGLVSHPDHTIAKNQMKGFGGLISFIIKADMKQSSLFIDSVEIPQIAPSLGGVESLIEQPALMSYYEMSSEERNQIGIYDNLIRLSVGIEDTEDLIADLQQALNKI